MITEKTLDANLRDRVKAVGGWSIKLLTSHVTGLPDRMLLFQGGRIAFAEIKSPGDKPRAIQKAVHRKLIRLGFDVYVVDSKAGINSIMLKYG